jgi:ABC-type amino acid transport substrate-binding protein
MKAAFAALACALISAPAVAQEAIDKIKQTGTITVGHRDASIPFSSTTTSRSSRATPWTSARPVVRRP